MKKRDPDLLIRILDDYSSGYTVSLTRIAERHGLSFRSIYQWLKLPDLIIPEWNGFVGKTFGECMQQARSIAKAIVVGNSLEEYCLRGRKVSVWHHGVPSYVDCEIAASCASEEEFKTLCELGVCWPDKKKRVKNPETGIWERVIATRMELAPSDLIFRFAAANMPGLYGHKSEVTMRGNVSLGVTTIAPALRRPVPEAALPFARPSDLDRVPVTETIGDGGQPEVFSADDDLDELLGVDDDSAPRGADLDEVEPERVTRSEPSERETSPPPDPMLAPTKTIPEAWRVELEALERRQAEKNRRA